MEGSGSRKAGRARARPPREQDGDSREAQATIGREDAAAYRQYLELAAEGIWRFAVRPAVRVTSPPARQAEAILERASLSECNEAFARLHGYERPADMVGLPLSKILAGTREEQVRFIAHSIQSGYRIVDAESATLDQQGRTVWTLNNVVGVVERGNLVGGWGSSRNITDRKAAVAALRASEERLALALGAASDGVYDVDLRSGETYYSPAYYTMLGYTPGEFPPSDASWKALLHPDDRKRAQDMLERCLSGEVGDAETEFRLRTKSGEWRRILSRGRVVARDENGAALRLVGTHRDITDRWEANEALRYERDRARAYLDIAEVMLVALDPDGRIALINRKGCRVLGYQDPRDLVGRDWFSTCLPPRAVEETRRVFRRMMAGEVGPVEYFENPVVTRTGEEREFAWHNALLRDAQGHVIGSLSSGEDITERRQTEHALSRTLSLLSRSEEISHVGSWELDLTENRLAWSDELFRIFGLEPEELVPTDAIFYDILHPEDRDAVGAAYEDALRDGRESYESTHRLVRPRTGEVRFVHEKCSFVRDPDGHPLRVYGVVEDITERRRAEAAVRESEQKYRLLVETASEAVFVAQDGYLKFANPATARILGRAPEDVASHPFPDFIHPDDRAIVVERHARRLEGESVETGYAFRVLHADGTVRWVELNAVRMEWEGRPATLNFVTDITERTLAEEALAESEERFRQILAESPLGVVSCDRAFRFMRVNRAFCRMLGYTEDELLSRSFPDVTHPDHRSQDVEAVTKLLRGEIPVYRTEKRYVRRDGSVLWASIVVSALRDARGRFLHFVGMIEDVTARKAVEAELVERERRYRELADDLPTCVFETDLAGRLTFTNRTARDWFGYSEGEVAGGKTILDMVSEAEHDRATTTMRHALETGSVPAGEYTAVRKDGTTFPALVSSRAIVEDGRAVGIRGILIDISERVEAARRIESALAGTIRALAVTTEMRDPYTAGHQERVTELACAIGEEMGLSGDRLEGLRVAGILHDVGKVSVPAEILSKPTTLTATEFGLVKIHPESGHEILRAIDFPWPVAEIVLEHHERMDGSGYPRGLCGEAILLEARILAVADVVEAIVSHRPYRPARAMAAAVEDVVRGAGTLYDAGVVAACQRLFEQGRLPLVP